MSAILSAIGIRIANDECGNARNIIVATTEAVVLVTMFINGGLTNTVCEWLGVQMGVDVNEYLKKVIISSSLPIVHCHG